MRTSRKDLAARVEAVVALAKRRGFVFASSEIYGGTRSAWDYGPLGVALKENIRRAWWQSMVRERPEVVGLDSAIILAPEVWRASGHLEAFVDPLTECRSCHRRWRADHLLEAHADRHGEPPADLSVVACPHCGVRGQFTETRMFNGLLQTQIGPVADAGAIHYLRPETAQGIFVNFTQVMTAARRKPPFGIAQVGKSFRNEITPGNFIFRTREFEQMEMEYFVPPGTDEQWHEYWIEQRWRWYTDLGMQAENLRRFEHPREKLSHYAKRTVDIEYRFGFAGSEWAELEGIANRTDFDLRTHSAHSGSDLSYFDQQSGTRWTPFVIEPAAGLTRAVLAFLLDAYDEDEAPTTKGGMERRLVLRLDPRLAPVTAAVLPLSRNAELSGVAERLAADLSRQYDIELDDAGAIGRRYRRADEVGTPYAITIDFETAADGGVTIRERDSMVQVRVPIEGVRAWLGERMWPGG
ncbi:MAG: glycine--tRNA ligase [Actinomycetales bacterium]|nr:glycine--tRNA ligase [Actinomycetales bacterium]